MYTNALRMYTHWEYIRIENIQARPFLEIESLDHLLFFGFCTLEGNIYHWEYMRIEYTHWECIRIENVYALGMYTPEFTYTLLFIVVSKTKSLDHLLLFRALYLREEYIRIENVYALRIYTNWEYTSTTIRDWDS